VIHTGCQRERGLTHRGAVKILPMYVNGSLGSRLLRDIEVHLCDCRACQRESSALAALFEAVAGSWPERQVDEARLTALLARIDRYEMERANRSSAVLPQSMISARRD
jgi:hypothetical protein